VTFGVYDLEAEGQDENTSGKIQKKVGQIEKDFGKLPLRRAVDTLVQVGFRSADISVCCFRTTVEPEISRMRKILKRLKEQQLGLPPEALSAALWECWPALAR